MYCGIRGIELFLYLLLCLLAAEFPVFPFCCSAGLCHFDHCKASLQLLKPSEQGKVKGEGESIQLWKTEFTITRE